MSTDVELPGWLALSLAVMIAAAPFLGILGSQGCDLPRGPERHVADPPYWHGQTSPCIDRDGNWWVREGDRFRPMTAEDVQDFLGG